MTDRAPQQSHDVAAGIARLEGYLLAQSRLTQAQEHADEFADLMPWLTTSQREEVVRLYTQDHIAVSRRALEFVSARAAELRVEYTARYETLRRRLLCRSVAALVTAALLCTCAALLTAYR
ncbi:hypothetical protein J7E88_10160 [Streptomyces sp. ISL-10]|uniref:hypothetical protein n=1 Tax=Streptomyces sp. ISL-10 TaxID=2819172 RepID=UPI001BE707F2|nr:hypothetical protein [Streptomyces sp. ISL-10]MBT2365673.1 hypothetical protein [Streptomyces sp. ISL-10]